MSEEKKQPDSFPLSLRHNPQVLFWIAEFTDGSCLCQFDPETGAEAKFKAVDQSRLTRFGWYPVTRKLADRVKEPRLRVNPFLRMYRLDFGPGRHLIAHRQEKIHRVNMHVCLACGFLWQFRKTKGELDYPYSPLHVVMTTVDSRTKKERKIGSPQCPKCKAYTLHICPDCHIERTKYHGDKEGEFVYRCNLCQKPLPDQVKPVHFEERHTEYFLGYEQNGQRFIMRINEGGNVEVH